MAKNNRNQSNSGVSNKTNNYNEEYGSEKMTDTVKKATSTKGNGMSSNAKKDQY